MQERQRHRIHPGQLSDPGPASGIFDDPFGDAAGGMATVSHGTYVEQLPVAQMTVGHVRSRFRDRMDIHPDAHALLDGDPVDEDTVVRTGQTLTFVRPAGEKGRPETCGN